MLSVNLSQQPKADYPVHQLIPLSRLEIHITDFKAQRRRQSPSD